MTEVIRDDSFIQSTQPERPERTLAVVPNVEPANQIHHDFDVKTFIDYMEHSNLSSVSVLTKLLENVGVLPSDLEPVEQEVQQRQHLLDHIARAKDKFDSVYIDSDSPIGINRTLIKNLYDKTEQYDKLPELIAFDSLSHRVSSMQRLHIYKSTVNEAEYLYRIFLSGEIE